MPKFFKQQPDNGREEFEEDIDNETENKEIKENTEQNIEGERFNIETVSDFTDSLKWSYDEAEDEHIKRQLAHQIIKIETGLGAAKLNSKEVKVSVMPDGVLGLYDPNNSQIEASEDMLSDFSTSSQLFKTVFVHEKVHKDGIADEGLTQTRVMQKISAAPGIYTAERQEAKRTFYKESIDKVLDIYDIEHPEKLVDYYLEIEINKIYSKKKKKIITEKDIEKVAKKQADKLSERFKDGAERLYKKLEKRRYSFKEKIEEILRKK